MLPIDGGSGPDKTIENGLELNRNTNFKNYNTGLEFKFDSSSMSSMFKLVSETQIQYNMV